MRLRRVCGQAILRERLRRCCPCVRVFPCTLTAVRAKADFISPHELYSWLLDTQGARRRFTGRMGEETHDPIDEFLGQALLYERSHPPSLQGFLHWLNRAQTKSSATWNRRGSVRIMTVHGAKGLQAPIVILPDTVETPKMRDGLLWQEMLPFWPCRRTGRSFCASLYDEAEAGDAGGIPPVALCGADPRRRPAIYLRRDNSRKNQRAMLV